MNSKIPFKRNRFGSRSLDTTGELTVLLPIDKPKVFGRSKSLSALDNRGASTRDVVSVKVCFDKWMKSCDPKTLEEYKNLGNFSFLLIDHQNSNKKFKMSLKNSPDNETSTA